VEGASIRAAIGSVAPQRVAEEGASGGGGSGGGGAPSPAPAPAAPAATATSSAWNAAIVKAAREAVEKGVAQFLAL
jgi:hypothetical protein